MGTLTGLAGALVAERVAVMVGVSAMLPVLAVVNLFCAWQIRRLARSTPSSQRSALDEAPPDLAAVSPQSGLHVLARAPYLRNLAALVLLGTIGAALADYVFKAQAVETFGRGESLLRFFALYYAGVSLLSFIVQTTASALALERLGLGLTASTPSLALAAGGLVGLIVPPALPARCSPRTGRVGVARLALPDRLRDLLHADCRPTRSARPSRSSTSASIESATRSAAVW